MAGTRPEPGPGSWAAAIGAGCTVRSERLTTAVRVSWTYAETMPAPPPFGTGLLPLLPPLGLVLARQLAITQQPPACETLP
jgi:hypothetical protein